MQFIVTEIDKPVIPEIIINDSSGVYKFKIFGKTGFIDNMTFSGIPQIQVSEIKSLRNGLVELTQVYTRAEVNTVYNSYYFDADDSTVYFNLYINDRPFRHYMEAYLELGIIVGYVNAVDYSRDNWSYYRGDNFYEPRITKCPSISLTRDSMFFGVQSHPECTVELTNVDGYFDKETLDGCIARIYALYPGEEITDSRLVWKGIIGKTVRNKTSYTITVGDYRNILNVPINDATSNRTDYPYVDDDNVDKTIPLAIGKQEAVELIPVNYNQAVSTLDYVLCAVTAKHKPHSVQRVYKKVTDSDTNVESEVEIAYTFNRSKGTITVNRDDAYDDPTADEPELTEIYADYIGWYYTDTQPYFSSMDLISQILDDVLTIPCTSKYYDLMNWDKELIKARKQNRTYSIYVEDNTTTINDTINKICESSNLVFTAGSDGYLRARVDEYLSDVQFTIDIYDLIDGIKTQSDISSTIAKTKITYGYGSKSDKSTLNDDSQYDTIRSHYKSTTVKELETVCADKQSAQQVSNYFLSWYGHPRYTVTYTIPYYTNSLHKLSDISSIIAPRDRQGNKAIYDVIGIKKSLDEYKVEITCVHRRDITTTAGYRQGRIFGSTIYKSKLLGKTETII